MQMPVRLCLPAQRRMPTPLRLRQSPPTYIEGRLKASLLEAVYTSTFFPGGSWVPHLLMPYCNQPGAMKHQDFVSKEVADLLARSSIMQTDRPPPVVKPLIAQWQAEADPGSGVRQLLHEEGRHEFQVRGYQAGLFVLQA